MALAELMRRVPLFATLDEEELRVLASCLTRRVFAKDMILFHKGNPAQSLYLLESGAVRIFVLSDAGQEITLDVYAAGECLGESALLEGVHSTSAIALHKTVTYTLRRADFLHCLDEHPQVARSTMVLLAQRHERLIAYAEKLAFLDVAGRVAALLLELTARYGRDGEPAELDPCLTQSELASWCAASREMVNKVLHTYKDQGLVALTGHTIFVLDRTGLERKIAN